MSAPNDGGFPFGFPLNPTKGGKTTHLPVARICLQGVQEHGRVLDPGAAWCPLPWRFPAVPIGF